MSTTTRNDAAGGSSAHDSARPGQAEVNFAEFAEELRLLAEAVLERVEPVLRRTASDGRVTWDNCSWCPVCAAAAIVRGEHHDVVAAIADHGTAIVTVLREALAGVPVEPVIPPDLDPESAEFHAQHQHSGTRAGIPPEAPETGSASESGAEGKRRFGRGPGTARRPGDENAAAPADSGPAPGRKTGERGRSKPGYVPINVTIKA
ncbi:hypothetical protein [Nocardia inohanensis]|uniref:hypothetical protein n=1 Tax=Nocardia inohanensis TaxID=209246 RepID=UPI000AB8172A|nr:hypothetical protein [Nocardia inohanensis]